MRFRELCHNLSWLFWVAGIGSLVCSLLFYAVESEPYIVLMLIASVLTLIWAFWASFLSHEPPKK